MYRSPRSGETTQPPNCETDWACERQVSARSKKCAAGVGELEGFTDSAEHHSGWPRAMLDLTQRQRPKRLAVEYTMKDYSRLQTLVANAPYAVMALLGTATIALGFGSSPLAVAGACGYLAYAVGGAVWTMVFICPYCSYYATRGCPCGYGMISAQLVPKGDHECFAEKFKRHIPVIVPLWLIPVVCGLAALWLSFSGWLAALIAVFVVNSFIVLPLVSRRHSCAECPQRNSCPWMASAAGAEVIKSQSDDGS